MYDGFPVEFYVFFFFCQIFLTFCLTPINSPLKMVSCQCLKEIMALLL